MGGYTSFPPQQATQSIDLSWGEDTPLSKGGPFLLWLAKALGVWEAVDYNCVGSFLETSY
jgi:hypothetical protein